MTHTQTAPVTSARRAKIGTGLIIGAVVLAVLFAIDIFAPGLFRNPLPVRLQDSLTLTLSVLIESVPFVVVGVFLSLIMQIWVPPGVMERILPRWPWARRLVLSLFGIFIPVCECGNVPFARGLLMRGFSVPDTMTFLVAAPIVNPIVIITTYQAFGFSEGILLSRLIGGFLVANLLGWLYSKHRNPDALLTEKFQAACVPTQHKRGNRTMRSLIQMIVEFRSVMLPLVIGSALAGAIQVFIPRDVLLSIGSQPVLSVVAMIALGMIVSLCSNVDSFFALAFASTFTPGSIVAFLLVGPLVDVKMLAMLRATFRTVALVVMVIVVVLFAFLAAQVVNILV